MGRRQTKYSAALAIVLLAPWVALADDAPRAFRVAPGYVVTSPAWVFTEEGKERVDASLERQVRELEQLRAENTSLRADIVTASGKPALTWRGALLLVGGGMLLGAAIAVPVALAVRR